MDADKILEMPQKKMISGVFPSQDLQALFEETVDENSMIILSSSDHTIGSYRRKDDFFLYDPNFVAGEASRCSHYPQLTSAIIACLYIFQEAPPVNVALMINILSPKPLRNEGHWVKKLANSPALLALQDNQGDTSLHMASQNNDVAMVSMLVRKMPTLNIVNNVKDTALAIAAGLGYVAIAELLLKGGINPNLPLAEGATALHYAAIEGHIDMIALLLQPEYEVEVNAKDKRGRTALFQAFKSEQVEAVNALIASGAKTCCWNDAKHSPMHVAIEQKQWHFVLLFLTPYKTIESIPLRLIRKLKTLHTQLVQALPKQERLLGEVASIEVSVLLVAIHKAFDAPGYWLAQNSFFSQSSQAPKLNEKENTLRSAPHLIS